MPDDPFLRIRLANFEDGIRYEVDQAVEAILAALDPYPLSVRTLAVKYLDREIEIRALARSYSDRELELAEATPTGVPN